MNMYYGVLRYALKKCEFVGNIWPECLVKFKFKSTDLAIKGPFDGWGWSY